MFSSQNYKCFYGIESPYKLQMPVCHHLHTKSFEESTYTPAILSPRSDPIRSASNRSQDEKNNSKRVYQTWMQLMQRLRDRTSSLNSTNDGTMSHGGRYSHSVSINTSPSLGIRREKTWAGREQISPWYNADLDSNKQVVSLINHYTTIISAENNERLTNGLHDRPKSILRPLGSPNKTRFVKEVTFAAN